MLNQLPGKGDLASDYSRIHTQLRDHFQDRVSRGDIHAAVEVAYHALALRDPEPAISLGIEAQHRILPLWDTLAEAVKRAPIEPLPSHIREQADAALTRALQQHRVEDSVRAIILYTWLLSAPRGDSRYKADLQGRLGTAYWSLPGGDRQVNLRQAIAYYKAALQVLTREAFPVEWALTQKNLGLACLDLAYFDRRVDRVRAGKGRRASGPLNKLSRSGRASASSASAARRATRLEYPRGSPYFSLWIAALPALIYIDINQREANLRQAITSFDAALQVLTREAFPVEWALTQKNLGLAYASLGLAYVNLGWPVGVRQADQQQAIRCFTQALEVYTREAFPAEWAMTQHSLGLAYATYSNLGDREANLRKAIGCSEAALQIFTSTHMDDYFQTATMNLEWAKIQLQKLNQPQQLPSPQQTQPGQEISYSDRPDEASDAHGAPA